MLNKNRPIQNEFEELTFCHLDDMFRLAFARVGNVQDAEDIVQETFLKAFLGFDKFQRRSSTKTWLSQILINNVKDYIRKRSRRITTVEIDDDLEEQSNGLTESGADERMLQEVIDEELQAALKTIPDLFLMPLLLREVNESSYEEISQILNIPKGTVMSRLSRARSMLRKCLTEEADVPSVARNQMKGKDESGGSFDDVQ